MAADPVYRHAEQLFLQYKNQETFRYCDQILAVDPLCQAALLFRGAAHRNLNNQEKAVRDFTALLELNPNFVFTVYALENRGTAFRHLGQYGNAVSDFNAVLALQPTSEWALEQRGGTYRKMALFQKALNDLNASLALNGGREVAYLARGMIHHQQSNHTAADDDLTKALELLLKPDNKNIQALIQAFEQRAAVRRILNRDRDALQDCLSALQRDNTLVFAKELQEDLRKNLDTGIPKKFIFNSAAPTAQYYVAPRYQFWAPTLENPAPSAPPAVLGRPLFP